MLVKSGCKLEAGKTVVVVSDVQDYYKERNKEYEPLIQRIKDMGFEVVKKNDYFDGYSSYREDDERLQDKLAKNVVYRCLVVEADAAIRSRSLMPFMSFSSPFCDACRASLEKSTVPR